MRLLQNFLLLLLLGNAPLKYDGFALQIADLTLEGQMSNGRLSATRNEAAAHHIAVGREEHELRELPSQLNCAFEAGSDERCGEVRECFFNGSCVVLRDANHLFQRNQGRILSQRFSSSGLISLVVTGRVAAKQEKRGASGAAIPQQRNARLHSGIFFHEQKLQLMPQKLLNHRFIRTFDFHPIGENAGRLKTARCSLARSREQQPDSLRRIGMMGCQFLQRLQPMRC